MSVSRLVRTTREQAPLFVGTTVAATYAMNVRDNLVKVNCAGTFTITLPPVSMCAGAFYLLRGVAGTSTVTIVDAGDSTIAISDTMNAAGEQMMVYSDGEAWNFIITPPA